MDESIVVAPCGTPVNPRTRADASLRRVQALALGALIAGACSISFAPIFVRLADTGPIASAFWRCALSLPLMGCWALAGRTAGGEARVPLLPLAGAGLFFAADIAVWQVSVLLTSVANSTLLGNTSPIFVTLAGWLLMKQKATRTYLAGLALAVAGMFLLAGANFGGSGTRVLGDALAALTGATYAGYMLSIKAVRGAGVSTAVSMAWCTTLTALVLSPIALFAPQPFWPHSMPGWFAVLGLALVVQILGHGLIAYAFAHLPASLAAVVLLAQPVMSTAFAWKLFDETVGPIQFAGGAIVLAGIWLSRKGSH